MDGTSGAASVVTAAVAAELGKDLLAENTRSAGEVGRDVVAKADDIGQMGHDEFHGAGMVNPVIAAKNIGDWMLVGVGSAIGLSLVGGKVVDILSSTAVGRAVGVVGKGFSAVGSFLATYLADCTSCVLRLVDGGRCHGHSFAGGLSRQRPKDPPGSERSDSGRRLGPSNAGASPT